MSAKVYDSAEVSVQYVRAINSAKVCMDNKVIIEIREKAAKTQYYNSTGKVEKVHSVESLARDYKMSVSQVKRIIKGTNWGMVQ